MLAEVSTQTLAVEVQHFREDSESLSNAYKAGVIRGTKFCKMHKNRISVTHSHFIRASRNSDFYGLIVK